MKALCFLIPLLLYITKFICSHHLNVGTVLFTKSHLCKKCWTDSEMRLLSARQVMQGVLPDPDYVDISQTGTITVLLEYFQSCFEVIGQSTSRKSQHLMFLALADALGGYLRSYILPLTRQAFYAGHIKYFEARKVYQFYEEIKEFLKTSGAGWAKPRMCTLNYKIRPLKISLKGCEAACSQLYLKDESQMEVCWSSQKCKNGVSTTELPPCPRDECGFHKKRRLIDIIEGMRSQENSMSYSDDWNKIATKIGLNGGDVEKIENIRKIAKHCKDRVQSSMTNTTKCEGGNENNLKLNNFVKSLKKRSLCGKNSRERQRSRGKELIVPLPILDDPIRPSAIGLPFKVRPIRTLCSPHAICILVRYYITVIKCMVTKTNNKCDLQNFNAHFQSWLSANVFPHLNDEEWYPAFGGVLRIEETIKNFGSETTLKCKSSFPNDFGFIFSKGYGFDEPDYIGNEECAEVAVPPCSRKESRTKLILGIVFIVILWIMAFCYCICCYCSSTTCEDEAQTDTLGNESTKKKADPSNSFIVQCLIKFFKRAEEEKKGLGPAKENINYNVYYGDVTSEAEEADIPEVRERAINDGYRAAGTSHREDSRQRRMNKGDTIVLPAQINPIGKEMPMGFKSIWPYTEFRNDADIGKHCAEKGLKRLFDRKEAVSKIPRRQKEQFRTLWKREKSAVRSSESLECISVQNENARSEGDRPKRKADVLSRSSYSESNGSGGSRRRRVIFLKRSRSAFDCPGSCRYSCDSSSASYSSSQPENDLPVEFFEHIMDCHNSFSKKSRVEEFQKPKTESESERDLTTSSSSEESFSSVKRVPQ